MVEGAGVPWQYAVENTGNVSLDAPTVTDDDPLVDPVGVDKDGDGSIAGDDADDADDTVFGNGGFDPGEVWPYEASGTAGDVTDGAFSSTYENRGTASADYTDDAGRSVTVTDTGMSDCAVVKGAHVTDAKMDDFGDNIGLIFFESEWDKHADSHSLFATLPARNRYHVLFDGAEEGGKVTLAIPFPFLIRGDDALCGEQGADKIRGGADDDIIVGGKGRDKLWGGKGADTFLFRDGDGRDRVLDFETDVDIIDLSQVTGIDGWNDLATEQKAKGLWLSGGDIEIFLKDIELPKLSEVNVIF